jgi:hypothetical protein
MAVEAGIVRDIDAAEDELATAREAMNVITDAEEGHGGEIMKYEL